MCIKHIAELTLDLEQFLRGESKQSHLNVLEKEFYSFYGKRVER